MPLPTYQDCMLPLLKLLEDGQAHNINEMVPRIADHFRLTDEERERKLPSGQQAYINNRIAWARTYLKKAGLVETPERGMLRITADGKSAVRKCPGTIDNEFLKQYKSFVEFWSPSKRSDSEATEEELQSTQPQPVAEQTPDEAIDNAYQSLRNSLADELLEQVMKCSPLFFEQLVLDLLLAMGYGGAFPGAGTHSGRSGDGGIDGIIREDKLGLDMICIQAKRWKDSVGRPLVQAFVGSMEAHRAKKGVMLTTSTFSRDAHEYVERIERRIVLIDGKQLAQLMIDHDIGVSPAKTYTVKRIDSDYFSDET